MTPSGASCYFSGVECDSMEKSVNGDPQKRQKTAIFGIFWSHKRVTKYIIGP